MSKDTISVQGGLIKIPRANSDGVRAFKGLPYAAAPVGPLRWRAPAPVTLWSGVRAAETFGANSLQGVVFDDIDPSVPGVSEDCLYLNVWTPVETAAKEKLPVFFWIHGGGFVVGSGAEPRYDGSRLAAKGIVVVTVNHRLNALGYLAHPELTAESPTRSSGAYAMLDLVAALGWVRDNIGAFGGDPSAVTIGGESAGSIAVSALMASPLAKGLFARAIGESGALFASPTRKPPTLADGEAEGLAFARKVGANSLAELRAAPAAAILAAAPGLGFRPIVDGHFLPRAPAEIFSSGAQNDVPLMAGWNKDEGFNFTLLQGENAKRPYRDIVREIFKDKAEAAFAHYPDGDSKTAAASARALGGDLVIIHATWAWIEAQRKTGRSDIFQFRFDRCPLTPEGWFGQRSSADAGAFHAGEILYVFDNLHAFPWLLTEGDRAIAELASRYWVNFVKTGDPNGPGLPQWPSLRAGEPRTMVFDARPVAKPQTGRAVQEFLASVVASR